MSAQVHHLAGGRPFLASHTGWSYLRSAPGSAPTMLSPPRQGLAEKHPKCLINTVMIEIMESAS